MRTTSCGPETGQASAEYAGLLALLSLLAVALLTVAPAGALADLGLTVCDAAGFCDGAPGTAPPPTPAESLRAALALPLDEFLVLRASPERDPRLDWTEDGCSNVPDSPLSHEFHDACVRHDFAYRNAGLLGYSDAERAAADARFRADMKLSCGQAGGVRSFRCRALADTYYRGVRLLGPGSYDDRPVDLGYAMGP